MPTNALCLRCGRPLSNPVSLSVGIGPVCRVSGKNASHEVSRNQYNLFTTMQSLFSWGIAHPAAEHHLGLQPILWLQDEDPDGDSRSLTNDMSRALAQVDRELVGQGYATGVKEFLVIYQDSARIWDGVSARRLADGREVRVGVSFFSLNCRDRAEAEAKIWDAQARGASVPEPVEA